MSIIGRVSRPYWRAATGVSLAFAAVHFLRPGKREDSVVEWWSGFAQIIGFINAVPPPWLLFSAFVSLLIAGLILAGATLWTRSLWLAIGLHAGWIFCQQTLQWLAKYRVKPPEAFWPWIGPNVVSGAVPTGLLPLGALALTSLGLWYYLRNASADSRSS